MKWIIALFIIIIVVCFLTSNKESFGGSTTIQDFVNWISQSTSGVANFNRFKSILTDKKLDGSTIVTNSGNSDVLLSRNNDAPTGGWGDDQQIRMGRDAITYTDSAGKQQTSKHHQWSFNHGSPAKGNQFFLTEWSADPTTGFLENAMTINSGVGGVMTFNRPVVFSKPVTFSDTATFAKSATFNGDINLPKRNDGVLNCPSGECQFTGDLSLGIAKVNYYGGDVGSTFTNTTDVWDCRNKCLNSSDVNQKYGTDHVTRDGAGNCWCKRGGRNDVRGDSSLDSMRILRGYPRL